MTGTRVSVIVVSHGRPAALARCLTGVGQLYYHPYEIVVAADAAGRAVVAGHPLGARIKVVGVDRANISVARNAGAAAAGGDVLAFIDDDAVPEPGWLDHLIAPIARNEAEATGGFVRGRNGIGFQWRARVVDRLGVARPVPVPAGDAPFAPAVPEGGAVKTEGTNMAVRREILRRLGGFDPRFHFYLEESDLNLRMAAAGYCTLLVPLAEVHHGFAPSVRRRADRMPLDLFDIGASSAVFWHKHAPEGARGAARAALVAEQRARLLRHMLSGACEPRDVGRLLSTLDDGLDAGAARLAEAGKNDIPAAPGFRPVHNGPPSADMLFLGGRPKDEPRLMNQAQDHVGQGGRASVLVLGALPRRHWLSFTDGGVWLQRGGIWGRADRDTRERPSLDGAARHRREERRVASVRFHPSARK